MTIARNYLAFQELPQWHRDMLCRFLNTPFPGQAELLTQIVNSRFSIIDDNQSLEICPPNSVPAPVIKTIPVEAYASDKDGVPILSLLFTRNGLAYMLEIFRADGGQLTELPPVTAFNIMVLEA